MSLMRVRAKERRELSKRYVCMEQGPQLCISCERSMTSYLVDASTRRPYGHFSSRNP